MKKNKTPEVHRNVMKAKKKSVSKMAEASYRLSNSNSSAESVR